MENKVLIIAEAGVNHNGDYNLAKELALAAKDAGADIVKFQTAVPELVISKFAPKADYQEKSTNSSESQLEMCRKIHLPLDKYAELQRFCNEVVGIEFLSTPFDFPSIDVLKGLNIDTWKIPSGEITNLPYLEKIGSFGDDVIISTGMSTMEEVKDAINVLINAGTQKEKITVLHCNTEYPTPYEDVNLRAMNTLSKELGVKIGYSDHTLGVEVPVAAVALGATVIEKHFTLDRNMVGPDHKASLLPEELEVMVKQIRNVEKSLGKGIKEPSKSEKKNTNIARRSIVAKCNIEKGDVFTVDNLTVKRPGNGISPMKWYDVIGKTAPKDYLEDELI